MAEAPRHLVIIGGGAAGFFGAIRGAEAFPGTRVTLLEATRRVLAKVRVSGGGRCNVTHHCFDPAVLVQSYPRGARELRGPFSRFQPRDTVAWFAARGVELKVEDDGRMFPITDDSATIATCLERAASSCGVSVRLGASVTGVQGAEPLGRHPPPGVQGAEPPGRRRQPFTITFKEGPPLIADRLLIATGSSPQGYSIAQSLGHTIIPLVPSLFTFKIADPRLTDLAGVAVPHVRLQLHASGEQLSREGPLLITHWGLSGPAVLKLSAFGALPLHASAYAGDLFIDFLPSLSPDAVAAALRTHKERHPRQAVHVHAPFDELPRRLWARLVAAAGIADETTYADLPKGAMQALATELSRGRYAVRGKGPFKEEFVTAGGVSLPDVDLRTMESRRCPGLFFAGEVLDIDGITGGFNFQAAWTTAWIAGGAFFKDP